MCGHDFFLCCNAVRCSDAFLYTQSRLSTLFSSPASALPLRVEAHSHMLTAKTVPEFPGVMARFAASSLELLVFLIQRQHFVDAFLFLLIILMYFKVNVFPNTF